MDEIWFSIVAVMLVVFAVLEGWDFGAGALHLLVARTPNERRQVVAAIGTLWVWHEVWLVGAGGVFLMAFPAAMATAFSGYYLALTLVLWCLLLRGIALECGGHLTDPLWRSFWDVVFAGASFLLAALFGIALGNLLRGVPLSASGRFSLALFTNFSPYGAVGLIDWYTLSIGAVTVVLLMAHGAAYLMLRTTGPVHDRSRRLAGLLWPIAVMLLLLVSWQTMQVRPDLAAVVAHRPLVGIAAFLAAIAATAVIAGMIRRQDRLHFLGSVVLIISLVGGAFAVLYPVILHSTLGDEHSLRAHIGDAERTSMGFALWWWPVALIAAVGYLACTVRLNAGTIGPDDAEDSPQPGAAPPEKAP